MPLSRGAAAGRTRSLRRWGRVGWARFTARGTRGSIATSRSIRPYSGLGTKIKVSSDGGSEPAWARSGREIFYRTADTLMAVPIETQPELSAGAARTVIPDPYMRWGDEDGSRNYDVSPDGSRFLVIKSVERKDQPITRIHLIANWPAELLADPTRR